MNYLESKKYEFEKIIGTLYYKGCLDYNEIYIIALMYFQIELNENTITYKEVKDLVFKNINSLIDLD